MSWATSSWAAGCSAPPRWASSTRRAATSTCRRWRRGPGRWGRASGSRGGVASRLPLEARERLVTRVVALPCPVRGLELVLYAREDLADAAFQINLNAGPRMPFAVAYDPAEVPRFWFVL